MSIISDEKQQPSQEVQYYNPILSFNNIAQSKQLTSAQQRAQIENEMLEELTVEIEPIYSQNEIISFENSEYKHEIKETQQTVEEHKEVNFQYDNKHYFFTHQFFAQQQE